VSAGKVIRALLIADGGVLALCPAARIVAGVIPQGSALPAISVMRISHYSAARIDAQAPTGLATSRVQVSVLTKDYAVADALVIAARKACNFQRGSLGGVAVISVVRDVEGPDMENDDARIQYRTIDFMVTYHEPN